MSSIAMAADSTQNDLQKTKKKSNKRKKHRSYLTTSSSSSEDSHDSPIKKKQKKKGEATKDKELKSSDSNCESDLDLSKELLPMSGYMEDKEAMIENMFKSVSSMKLKTMLPEILQPFNLKELKARCLEQLHVMSNKRINKILEGVDTEMISSSSGDEGEGNKEVVEHVRDSGKEASKSFTQPEPVEVNEQSNITDHNQLSSKNIRMENKPYQFGHEIPSKSPFQSSDRNTNDLDISKPSVDAVKELSKIYSKEGFDKARKSGEFAIDEINKQLDGSKNKEFDANAIDNQDRKSKSSLAEEAHEKKGEGMSKTQLEILELEMRARAIKAMLKAQDERDRNVKRRSCEGEIESQPGHPDGKISSRHNRQSEHPDKVLPPTRVLEQDHRDSMDRQSPYERHFHASVDIRPRDRLNHLDKYHDEGYTKRYHKQEYSHNREHDRCDIYDNTGGWRNNNRFIKRQKGGFRD